ncbi:sce7726 family protein [Rhizobium sp. CC-YZS058]|uniref:sce7726 family protein n=1 Tax=Rhizobium sp. CC-YZS058 TaxID=3042153 RepID=UPI002B05E66D|nr:sce7726 family protein [Rhizobium sp. CC-YZS058]MEA3536992.1 sce7726 family protein [Rhizobium sp. CC-YZS058]
MNDTSDPMIRAEIRRRLSAAHLGKDAVIVDELRVNRGGARIDVAVVNGHIDGYEIKSDRDTLQRLDHQVGLYGQVADRMTLVVGESHRDEALLRIPDWWAVMVARRAGNGCRLVRDRRGRLNGATSIEALLRMLERHELIALLSGHGACKGASKRSLPDLVATAAGQIPRGEIVAFVRHALKVRTVFKALGGMSAYGRSAIICGPSSKDAGSL